MGIPKTERRSRTDRIVPRHGVMPTWEGRLDAVALKMVAAYVHALGGGK